jgi:hypothetical protein
MWWGGILYQLSKCRGMLGTQHIVMPPMHGWQLPQIDDGIGRIMGDQVKPALMMVIGACFGAPDPGAD